jgi:ribosome-associated protein
MESLQVLGVFIPMSELMFSAVRSSGPGGQHVNKVSTKVILEFDAAHSLALSDEQKALILQKLGGRLNKEGVLMVSSQESRSQLANKQIAMQKLTTLLEEALRPRKKRRRTRTPLSVRYARLQSKKHRAKIKENRKKPEI